MGDVLINRQNAVNCLLRFPFEMSRAMEMLRETEMWREMEMLREIWRGGD
jgi:hypothetical protein